MGGINSPCRGIGFRGANAHQLKRNVSITSTRGSTRFATGRYYRVLTIGSSRRVLVANDMQTARQKVDRDAIALLHNLVAKSKSFPIEG